MGGKPQHNPMTAKAMVEDRYATKPQTQEIQRAPGYAMQLPAAANDLPEAMKERARGYIGARRQAGQALLDAARYVSEAKALAVHGQWQAFLDTIEIKDDMAEGLQNIHAAAMRDERFAEAIRTSWLKQSTAAILARKSTHDSMLARALNGEKPPTVKQVRQIIDQEQQPKIRNVTDFEDADAPHMADVERILHDAEPHGERTGTKVYQEAYSAARNIRDVALYNRAFALIDRAVDGTMHAPIVEDAKTEARRLAATDHATAIQLTTQIRSLIITEQIARAAAQTRQLLALLDRA